MSGDVAADVACQHRWEYGDGLRYCPGCDAGERPHPVVGGDVEADVAAVLAAHAACGSTISESDGDYWATYECGVTARIRNSMAEAERAHLASALAPLIAARVEAAKAEALAQISEAFWACFTPDFRGVDWRNDEAIQTFARRVLPLVTA